MDEILGYFLEKPQRLISIGHAAFTAGMMVVVIGLVGFVAKTGMSSIQSLGKASGVAVPSLGQIYPDLWTWWVPETLTGAMPALVLAGFGIWLVMTGRKLVRVYG